ncbi:hypothetical protein [Sphingobium lactosutens]|uniref:hypothetical protein n=1 Tax=Sphingobium lactosutens TaxID=522773 RepID=UPI0015C050A3|nr:hypothetical protein [Sphingobium lactosutens]
MTKLLLAGATGLVGSEALALSLEDERVTKVIAPTILPPMARISPARTIAAFLIEAAIGGAIGTHRVSAADIARAAMNHHP